MQGEAEPDRARAGAAFGVLAYTVWGFAPIYWKQLSHLSAIETQAHRVIWALAIVVGLLAAGSQLRVLRQIATDSRALRMLAGSALLIGCNWTLFIWAVNHDRIVETSLGYFLTPLLNVALGMGVLRERLRPAQLAAVAIAAVGVALLAFEVGSPPWVSLGLGGSFALYGLLRKLVGVPSIAGLAVETSLLVPIAIACLLLMNPTGGAALGAISDRGPATLGWLVGGGVMTAAPLVWFASAAKRLPLSTLGLLQYLAPSVSLGVAVGLYGEPFEAAQMRSFGCIWFALIVYTVDTVRNSRSVTPPTSAR